MGYLEKLPCECIVFGKGAVVPEEGRGFPVVIFVGCPVHNPKGVGVTK